MKTQREEGAGWGQITRAYRQDGTLRFDALFEMKTKYPKELGEWSWSNVYDRPDLQAKGLILMMKDNYQTFRPLAANDIEGYAFADSVYNGGPRDLNLARRACGLSPGCDPKYWFGHVEKFCMKSKTALYGQRSACDINTHHVDDVLNIRAGKYIKYF